MRKLIAIAAAAALFALPAFAAPVYAPGQQGTAGVVVTGTNLDGSTSRFVLTGAMLTDSSGAEKATASNPLIVQQATGSNGQVVGNVASGATDSGNPVKVGGVYNTTLPTFTNGQRGDLQLAPRGALNVTLVDGATTSVLGTAFPSTDAKSFTTGSAVGLEVVNVPYLFNGSTWDRARGDTNGAVNQPWAMASARWNYAAAASGIVNTTTAVTVATAAGASVRNYLASCQISHDTLGGVTEFVFRDGAAGTVLYRTKLQTAAIENEAVNFTAPLKGTANTLMEAATLTAVTGGVYVNCQGFTGS